jgi:hypothetical protein
MAKSEHNRKRNVTETPDTSHVKNVDVAHEISDVNVGAILTFVGLLTAMTIVIYVGMYFLFWFFNTREVSKEPQPGPMAMTEKERLPPEPRLQVAPGFDLKLENGQSVNLELREPQAEYRELRNQWEQALNEGLRDQSGRVVGVPIDEAIKAIANGNVLPSRTPPGADGKLDDYAISIPTFASSGRVTEKIR